MVSNLVMERLCMWGEYRAVGDWPQELVAHGAMPCVAEALQASPTNSLTIPQLVSSIKERTGYAHGGSKALDMINLKAYVRCYPALFHLRSGRTAAGRPLDVVELRIESGNNSQSRNNTGTTAHPPPAALPPPQQPQQPPPAAAEAIKPIWGNGSGLGGDFTLFGGQRPRQRRRHPRLRPPSGGHQQQRKQPELALPISKPVVKDTTQNSSTSVAIELTDNGETVDAFAHDENLNESVNLMFGQIDAL